MQVVPDGLRQAGGGVEHHLQAREEALRQSRVGVERPRQLLEAARHVEVHRGRDLAQVAQAFIEGTRHRLTAVNEERATVVQHQAEVMAAAEGVMPGKPVADNRRLIGEKGKHCAQHLLIAAQHSMRGDDAPGNSG